MITTTHLEKGSLYRITILDVSKGREEEAWLGFFKWKKGVIEKKYTLKIYIGLLFTIDNNLNILERDMEWEKEYQG